MDYYNDSDDDSYYDEIEEDEVNDSLYGIEEAEVETSSSSSGAKAPFCKVIKKESLLAAQKGDLQRVMDVMSLKEHSARTLLIHFHWDVETVLTKFADMGEEWVYKVAGLSVKRDQGSSFYASSSALTCGICFDEISAKDCTVMECGHYFCNECWTEHFIVKINEGQSKCVTCMAHKCFAICDTEIVRNLVSQRDPNLAEKFDRYLLESYIDDNKKVKWCPSIPHCGNAIGVDDEYCEVECSCGEEFCFSCTSEAHSPCSCLMWESWSRKNRDSSESINWIVANTKDCPRCHKPVEKNGGCNLVYCNCKQAFCWICGKATGTTHTWISIEGHTCGKYKETKVKEARRQIIRYTHYYTRYKAHKDSLKLETELKNTLREKIATLVDRDAHLRDFTWVETGFSRLSRSRKIISYSYPFAYYMFGNGLFKDGLTEEERELKKNLFEEQQQQLEAMTERLSLCLEEPFAEYTDEKLLEMKMKILNLSKVINNYCERLYDCIERDLLDPLEGATVIIAPYRSGCGESIRTVLEPRGSPR